jgi:phosphoribosylamine---glycine ligase
MNVLVIGSGAREHALTWKLGQSPINPVLHCAPGNPGMAEQATCHNIAVDDIPGLLALAKAQQVDLTVVGPEVPLSLGIVDAFQAEGLLIFGPRQAAAQLEASKAFAKEIMVLANVPTGGYSHAKTAEQALQALNAYTAPYVIKEDGLAAGKGVTIAATRAEAEAAITAAFAKGMTVVIEEFLHGQELSVLAICDGAHALPLVTAQDFKRAYDQDQGPNTGGMGAYAPVPWASPDLMTRIQTEVLQPVLATMAAQGKPYTGVLYAGLMITPAGDPKVIEFNARFGDPETQVVLPLIAEDLLPILLAAAQGDLSAWVDEGIAIQPQQSAVTVVLAAKGYPGGFEKGLPIQLPQGDLPTGQLVFQAGTQQQTNGPLVCNGGRVISAVGLGTELAIAREQAYQLADAIHFDNRYYRNDIALVASKQAVAL